jgi:hypothetical protein
MCTEEREIKFNFAEFQFLHGTINVREYWRGKQKMDNPEKLATQYVLDTTIRKQT